VTNPPWSQGLGEFRCLRSLRRAPRTLGHHHLDDAIVKVALELERIALSDDYFVENNLSPNIDFYSAITLQGARLTTEIFTVLYAIRVFDAQQHVVRVERRRAGRGVARSWQAKHMSRFAGCSVKRRPKRSKAKE
jgi:hypothetical protein